eukprot:6633635-Prymnesium_polylepis.1
MAACAARLGRRCRRPCVSPSRAAALGRGPRGGTHRTSTTLARRAPQSPPPPARCRRRARVAAAGSSPAARGRP